MHTCACIIRSVINYGEIGVEEDSFESREETANMVIVAVIIAITILIGTYSWNYVENLSEEVKPMVLAIMRELVILGALTLCAMAVFNSRFFKNVSRRNFSDLPSPEDEEHLQEMYEQIKVAKMGVLLFFALQYLYIIGIVRWLHKSYVEAENDAQLNKGASIIEAYQADSANRTNVFKLEYALLRHRFRTCNNGWLVKGSELIEGFNFARYLRLRSSILIPELVHLSIGSWLTLLGLILLMMYVNHFEVSLW